MGVLDLIKEAIVITKNSRQVIHMRDYIIRKQKEHDCLGNVRFYTSWEAYVECVNTMSEADLRYYYNKIRQRLKEKDDDCETNNWE